IGLRVVLHAACLPWRPSAPRVLLWHSLDESAGPISTSPDLFARQIEWLARKGYETWPARRYVQALIQKTPVPARGVALTVADGSPSVLEAGLPILRARGACATVFLVTGAAGERPCWTTPVTQQVLTWDSARRATTEGLEFESHTHTHAVLEE